MKTIKSLIQECLKKSPNSTNREITNYVAKKRHTSYKHLLHGNLIKQMKNIYLKLVDKINQITSKPKARTIQTPSLVSLGNLLIEKQQALQTAQLEYNKTKSLLLKKSKACQKSFCYTSNKEIPSCTKIYQDKC